MPRVFAGLGLLVVIASMWLLIGREQSTPAAPETHTPEPELKPDPEPVAPQPPAANHEAVQPTEQPQQAPAPAQAEPPPYQPMMGATLPSEQGPAKEYRKLFNSESRAASSASFEAKYREAFSDPKSQLFDSVECRRTMCRIRLNWSLLRFQSYLSAMNRARPLYELPIAASTTGPEDGEGNQPLEVFVKHGAP